MIIKTDSLEERLEIKGMETFFMLDFLIVLYSFKWLKALFNKDNKYEVVGIMRWRQLAKTVHELKDRQM